MEGADSRRESLASLSTVSDSSRCDISRTWLRGSMVCSWLEKSSKAAWKGSSAWELVGASRASTSWGTSVSTSSAWAEIS